MFDVGGQVRPEACFLLETIQSLEKGQLLCCQRAAERLLLQMGITFNVYGDSAGAERIFPFDLIPRIVRAGEWEWIERGLKQRIQALTNSSTTSTTTRRSSRTKSSPRRSYARPPFTAPSAEASALRGESGATSPEPISCVTVTARSMSSRITCASHPAFPTYWRTGT
jgi:hypothetical protein